MTDEQDEDALFDRLAKNLEAVRQDAELVRSRGADGIAAGLARAEIELRSQATEIEALRQRIEQQDAVAARLEAAAAKGEADLERLRQTVNVLSRRVREQAEVLDRWSGRRPWPPGAAWVGIALAVLILGGGAALWTASGREPTLGALTHRFVLRFSEFSGIRLAGPGEPTQSVRTVADTGGNPEPAPQPPAVSAPAVSAAPAPVAPSSAAAVAPAEAPVAASPPPAEVPAGIPPTPAAAASSSAEAPAAAASPPAPTLAVAAPPPAAASAGGTSPSTQAPAAAASPPASTLAVAAPPPAAASAGGTSPSTQAPAAAASPSAPTLAVAAPPPAAAQASGTSPSTQAPAAAASPPAPTLAVAAPPPAQPEAAVPPATPTSAAAPPMARSEARTPAATVVALSSPPAHAARQIVLRATADTWVQVRQKGGRVLLTRNMQAGESWPVPVEPDLLLNTGNADGLDLDVDGIPTRLTGAKGGVVRNVPLDADLLRSGVAVRLTH
jgi:hypothetical protein